MRRYVSLETVALWHTSGRVDGQRYVQHSTSFSLVIFTSVAGSGKPYEAFNYMAYFVKLLLYCCPRMSTDYVS